MSRSVYSLVIEALENISTDLNGVIQSTLIFPDKDTFVSVFNAAVEVSGSFERGKKVSAEESEFIITFYEGILNRIKELEKVNWVRAKGILNYSFEDFDFAQLSCKKENSVLYEMLGEAIDYVEFWDEIEWEKEHFGLARVISEEDDECETVEKLLSSADNDTMVIIPTMKIEKLG